MAGFPVLRCGVAMDDGEVFLFCFASLHDHAECTGGGGGFGDEDDATGIAIESSDDRWTVAVGYFVLKQRLDPAEQRGFRLEIGRMNDQWRGLVDDKPIR